MFEHRAEYFGKPDREVWQLVHDVEADGWVFLGSDFKTGIWRFRRPVDVREPEVVARSLGQRVSNLPTRLQTAALEDLNHVLVTWERWPRLSPDLPSQS